MAWRCLKDNVPTKIHCLEDHLMEQIEQLGGLADYNEHFVEMDHRVDKKGMSQTRGVHDIVRKFKLHADWEERRNNKQEKEIILLVKSNLKRKKSNLESDMDLEKIAQKTKEGTKKR